MTATSDLEASTRTNGEDRVPESFTAASIDGAATGTWQPGRVIAGRYRLDSPVGAGAMGVVWRAADLRLDRTVAVKQLLVPAGCAPEEIPQVRQQLFREARIAARLKHPQAVAVYDVTTDDDHQPVLVMEYVASQSLADVLIDRGALAPEQVARIGAETAAALNAAHEAGIVHRDVKPANILLPEAGDGASEPGSGTIKITDFGLASITGDGRGGGSGRVTGTPAFLAPETARGEPHTPASDVFSLGATLYAALEGTPPFGSLDDAATQLQRVAYGRAKPPRHAGPLTRPLLAMLHEDPTARPTMSQVAQVLTQVTSPEPRTLIQTKAPRRRRAAVALVAVLGIGLLGLLVTMLLTDDGTSSAANPAGPPSSHSTETPPPAVTDPVQLQQTVTDYYTLLADDPGRAWDLLGPALRDQNRDQYEENWSNAEDIRILGAPEVSGNTVVVDIEYTLDSGDRVRETHQHTMLTMDGTVLINTDDVLSTQVVKDGDGQTPQREDDPADDHNDATPLPPPPPAPHDSPGDQPADADKHGPGGEGGKKPGAKPVVDPGDGGPSGDLSGRPSRH